MIQFTRKYMITVLATFIVMVLSSASVDAAFKTVTLSGKKYVSLYSIKSAYHFQGYKVSGSTGVLTKQLSSKRKLILNLKAGSSYVSINTLKFVFSFPIIKSGGSMYISETDTMKVLDPIMRPKNISKSQAFRTVIIDPGHGGKDAGAVNRYGTEARYNLNVAKTLKSNLQKKGFKVIMTRESNVFLSLQQRVNLANRYKNAIFVSIHFNAASRTSARGIETFTLSPVGVAHYGRGVKNSDYRERQGNEQDSANIALASAVHTRMIKRTKSVGVPDRGIKRARFAVLGNIKHPAILVEGGFLSNPTEAKWIHNTKYQNSIAMAITEGIYNFRRAVK